MYRHPGSGHRKIHCDICGKKTEVRFTVRITDRYNTLYNMIVCKEDYEKTNPGAYPYPRVKERGLADKSYVRREGDPVYFPVEHDDLLPTAPRNLRVGLNPEGTAILLQWDGPEMIGSGRVVGYKVSQGFPQFGGHIILVENTNSQLTQYLDEVTGLSTEVEYKVAVITTAGTGPYSELAYYPTLNPDAQFYNYLGVSQTGDIMSTSSGIPIIL